MSVESDPGAGEPGSIRALAATRSRKATDLRGVHAEVVSAKATVTDSTWSGQARGAFITALDSAVPDLTLLADGLEAQASALTVYAGRVQQIKERQAVLAHKLQTSRESVLAAERSLRLSHQLLDRVVGFENATGRHERTPEILRQRSQLEQVISTESTLSARLEVEWGDLVAQRRGADAVCVTALSSESVLGRTARFTSAAIRVSDPAAVLRMLAGLSATDLAVLLEAHPALAEKLAATAPEDVAAWWTGLAGDAPGVPSAAQAALIAAIPVVIGNLGGVAYWARDQANRIVVDRRIRAAEKKLSDAKRLLPWAGLGTIGPGAGRNWAAADHERAREELSQLQAVKAALTGGARTLISLSKDVPPLAAVAIGDLDSAGNVTYTVPGMGTDASDMPTWAGSAANLYAAQEVFGGIERHAVVAWIGYRTPPVPFQDEFDFGVLRDEHAAAGAVNLQRDLAALNAVRAGSSLSLNVVAHSYGSTTASVALSEQDLNVDAFVNLGSAGIPKTVLSANSIHADAVFAGQAQNAIPLLENGDEWAWTGRYGSGRQNPMDPVFGAQAFNTDGTDGEFNAVTDHGAAVRLPEYGYLDSNTESLYNTALATTGNGTGVTTYVNPGLTRLQQSLLSSLVSGSARAY